MQITNKHNLPDWKVKELSKYVPHKPKDVKRMSVTSLIDCPAIRTLKLKHWDELEIDIASLIQASHGSMFHQLTDDDISEIKMELEIDGMVLVGKLDNLIFDSKNRTIVLLERKFTKVGQLDFNETLLKWEQQINCYAFMLKYLFNLVPDKLLISVNYRDWSKMNVDRRPDYPSIPTTEYVPKRWTTAEQKIFILDRLRYHREKPMDCPDRWERPDTWAVMKTGQIRAKRVLPSKEEAEAWMKERGGDTIVYRKGEAVRCKHFCECQNVCPYYR